MSVHIMAQVYKMDLPTQQKFLLVTLGDFANEAGGSVYPSVATLCKRTGLGDRTVRRYLSAFRESGVIEIEDYKKVGNRGRIPVYRLVMARIRELVAEEEEPDEDGPQTAGAAGSEDPQTAKSDPQTAAGDATDCQAPAGNPPVNPSEEKNARARAATRRAAPLARIGTRTAI